MIKSLLASPTLRILSCIFLIAGTCVGGGMLALPVSGGRSGFFPSMSIMVVAWSFMTLSGLFYLEVSLWLREDAHIISMASNLLGRKGKYCCWLIYLFIGYASLVAYLAEGGKITGLMLSNWLPVTVDKTGGSLLYILVFGLVLLAGTKVITRVNSLLFCCMAALFVALVWASSGAVQAPMLLQQRWHGGDMVSLFPLMLTTFSYPGLVPVVVSTLQRNASHARMAIVGGTVLTFVTYLTWLAVVLGSVPYEGANGLHAAYAADNSAAYCLLKVVNNPLIASFAQAFGFFALTTSFIGVAWALHHFLADGLKIKNQGWGKAFLAGLIIAPSLFLTLSFEKVFFTALEISGGIGDSLISGLIPATMVWVGRYHRNYKATYQTAGGKSLVVFVMVVASLVLVYEIGHRLL